MIFRQGDVLLRRVESVPDNVTPVPRENGRIVLAHGEVTGHAHAILDEAAELVRTAETNQRFLKIMNASGVQLQHEEHATITLPPGTYEVIRQREYTSRDMPARYVAD
jgi:hypothetical protein